MSSYHWLDEVDTLTMNLLKHGKDPAGVIIVETKPGNNNTQQQMKGMVEQCLRISRRCGLVLGVIAGCFLTSSVLWVFYIVHAEQPHGANNNDNKSMNSKDDKTYGQVASAAGTFLYCLISGSLAWLVCFLTRNIVSTVLSFSPGMLAAKKSNEDKNDKDHQTANRLIMHTVIRNFECWFGIGCLMVIITALLLSSFQVAVLDDEERQHYYVAQYGDVWHVGIVLFLSMTVVAANVWFAPSWKVGISLLGEEQARLRR